MGRRLSVLPLLALIATFALPCAAQATITGTAFMDYNSNGAVGVGAFTAADQDAAAEVAVLDLRGVRIAVVDHAIAGDDGVALRGKALGVLRVRRNTQAVVREQRVDDEHPARSVGALVANRVALGRDTLQHGVARLATHAGGPACP